MDFFKSRNSSSTSSNHSNSSTKSSNSNSHNGGATYNLEYCTSSSSVSPYNPTISCPSSTAKTIVSVAMDEVLLPSSNGSSQSALKRGKRRASICLDDKDPEIGFEQPLAKRPQILHSLYQSDSGSEVSSVYPSPDGALLAHDIDARSSSDCLSTATEYDVASDDIPDSPNSLITEDDYNLEHEEIVITTSSSSNSAAVAATAALATISAKSLTTARSIANTQPSHIYVVPQLPQTHHLEARGERTPAQRHVELSVVSSTSKEQSKILCFDDYVNVHYDCMTPAAEPEPLRLCPLPALSWANAHDVWQLMCKKDEVTACLRDSAMLERHPGLQPRMRAILLDWLIEVCEVYKLHRETYYLAVDYLDRYLTAQRQVQKTHLQLIGITCLFVAAKVEEIYPPKIGEFAYVTDGACTEAEILQHEILLLQALDWNITPVTPMGWLGVYMQLNVSNRTPDSLRKAVKKTAPLGSAESKVDEAFIYPQFSGMEFVQTAQLLDLCSLDVGLSNYSYSVLAAAAISHTFSRETALRCSGLDWQAIYPCAHWMEPFFKVVCEESTHLHLLEQNDPIATKYGLGHVCPNIVTDESHIIQTHTTTLTMFDRAGLLQEQYSTLTMKLKPEASPATALICPEGLLTPPASGRKPVDSLDDDEGEDDVDDDHESDGDTDADDAVADDIGNYSEEDDDEVIENGVKTVAAKKT